MLNSALHFLSLVVICTSHFTEMWMPRGVFILNTTRTATFEFLEAIAVLPTQRVVLSMLNTIQLLERTAVKRKHYKSCTKD